MPSVQLNTSEPREALGNLENSRTYQEEERMMRRARIWLTAAALVALISGVAAPELWAIRLDETAIFIEINDTDGDAGIQIFLDGEGWKRMKVFDPDGRKVVDIRARGNVGMQGITELRFESAEPSFEEQPLDEFLALFPPGRYLFRGTTTEGENLNGRARLTHRIPDAPVLIFPNDDEVDPDDAVFEWGLVPDPPGSEIVGYQVFVECEEPDFRELAADVPPTVNRITVPPEFLEGGEECKWEVLAVEKSGNLTASEVEFGVD